MGTFLLESGVFLAIMAIVIWFGGTLALIFAIIVKLILAPFRRMDLRFRGRDKNDGTDR